MNNEDTLTILREIRDTMKEMLELKKWQIERIKSEELEMRDTQIQYDD